MSGENNWTNLILQQLETLAGGIDGLRSELQEMRNHLVELRAREDRVQELRNWKERIDDVASPAQLRTAVQDIEDLKTFKTKAITIFTGVQMAMGGIWAFVTFMSG